jgi:outer membrane protein assembly factor BamD
MSGFLWRRLALAASVGALVVLGGCSTPAKVESPNATAERLYREAKEDAAAGTFERAIKLLERVEGLAAGSLLAQQAQLEMAYLQWRTGEREAALTAIDRFIKLNPSSPAFDYALYLRGVINFNDNLGFLASLAGQDLSERDQRASRDAYQSFKRLTDQFPESIYAPDARLRMDYIANTLAAYEVHVSRYYLRRGAYVAAANRAQQMVGEFPQSPSTEEALAIMIESYQRLELPQLREAAERVLQLNFPNSPYLAGNTAAARANAQSWWQRLKFW